MSSRRQSRVRVEIQNSSLEAGAGGSQNQDIRSFWYRVYTKEIQNACSKHASKASRSPWSWCAVITITKCFCNHVGGVFRADVHFPGGSDGKAIAYNVGDPGLLPGSGRSPGEGNGDPLQYSDLENAMDGGSWQAPVQGVTKSRTRLSNVTFHFSPEGEDDGHGPSWPQMTGIWHCPSLGLVSVGRVL